RPEAFARYRHLRPLRRRQPPPDVPHGRARRGRDAAGRARDEGDLRVRPRARGTITGEHGVGLAKKAFLRGQMGEASFSLLRKLKATLDPDNLLNPGKVFDA